MNPYYMTPETMAALKAEAQRLGQRLQGMRAQRDKAVQAGAKEQPTLRLGQFLIGGLK